MSPKGVEIRNLYHSYKNLLRTLVYTIYIERRSLFSICYSSYLSTGRGWGELSTLGESIIQTLADQHENLHNNILNPYENRSKVRFPIFVPLYRKEGYAEHGDDEEKVCLECK